MYVCGCVCVCLHKLLSLVFYACVWMLSSRTIADGKSKAEVHSGRDNGELRDIYIYILYLLYIKLYISISVERQRQRDRGAQRQGHR